VVYLKSSKAIGSFLGLGTHVWLVIVSNDGEKTTFSGSRVGKLLGVIKNFKRDYDKLPHRGEVIISPPHTMTQEEWDMAILEAGDVIQSTMNKELRFSGFFPCVKNYGNCCTIAKRIIELAGGVVPASRNFRGFTPGLTIDY